MPRPSTDSTQALYGEREDEDVGRGPSLDWLDMDSGSDTSDVGEYNFLKIAGIGLFKLVCLLMDKLNMLVLLCFSPFTFSSSSVLLSTRH